jgi:tetratricopeptide (TPR) repeat protein
MVVTCPSTRRNVIVVFSTRYCTLGQVWSCGISARPFAPGNLLIRRAINVNRTSPPRGGRTLDSGAQCGSLAYMHPGIFPRAQVFTATLLLAINCPSGRGASKDTWIEVQSPHFTVISNAGDKEARKIADQFEQFREVFHSSFPKLRVDLGKPLIIFAVKNEDTLKLLLPEFWEAKGRARPAGLYVPGEDCHFVAVRTNIEGDNPYEVVYHEYTHAILNLNFRGTPVWLGEGLAEFFGNSAIHSDYVEIGKPSLYHLRVLQESHLIPIDALLTADHDSPYYNEANRAGIFYAESWAITHYLMLDPEARRRNLLSNFLNAWDASGNQVEAAEKTFGDLKKFSDAMVRYARQNTFYMSKVNTSIHGDPKSFSSRALAPAEFAADRALFYLHTQRQTEAKASVDQALQADADLPLAYEAQGLLAYSQGNFSAAETSFRRAIELHSNSYFAYYFDAQAQLRRGMPSPEAAEKIRASLEKAININPQFAPAWAAMGSVYSVNPETYEKARSAGRHAVELEPGNLEYAIQFGYILLNTGKTADAKILAQRAQKAAKTTQENGAADAFLHAVDEREGYQQAVAAAAERAKRAAAEEEAAVKKAAASGVETSATVSTTPEPANPSESAITAVSRKHAHETQYASEGIVVSAECNGDQFGKVVLRVGNSSLHFFYSKFSSLYVLSTAKEDSGGQAPACSAWKSRRARLYFYKTKDRPYAGELDTVQFF